MSSSNTIFTTSDAVFAWIDNAINHERNLKAASFRLDRMEELSRLAHTPWQGAKIVHIAGSKGKGSMTAMLAAILDAYGLKTARYTSPHIRNVRERVSLANGFFEEAVYVDAGRELAAVVKKAGILPGGEGATYFELMTLFFFLCARRAKAQALVLETGIGGRLDATNIVVPDLSILMPIEREHCDILGDSIEAIAGEKAGIIKAGRPALIAPGQGEEALAVFEERCMKLGSPLIKADNLVRLEDYKTGSSGLEARLRILESGETLYVQSPFSARIQAQNAATAAGAALSLLGNKPESRAAIQEGIKRAQLPARFQILLRQPAPLVVDGSHTARSVSMALETYTELFGRGGSLVFSCARDKDVEAMASILGPAFDRIVLCGMGPWKEADPERMEKAFALYNRELERIEDPLGALERARQAAGPKGGVLVTGSFYLAASILAAYEENSGLS